MALTATMMRVVSRIEDLKVYAKLSARQISVLVGISPMALSNAIAGVTYLNCEKEKELSEVTLLLTTLEVSLRPLRLPEKTDDLRDLVNRVRENRVDLEKLNDAMKMLFGEREE